MNRNFPRLLTLTLSLEFFLAPIAPAFADDKKPKKDTASAVFDLMNKGSSLLNQTGLLPNQAMGPRSAYERDFQTLQMQKMPVQDNEVFNSKLLTSKIPGLAEYMATHPANLDCPVLKPFNIIDPEICEPSGNGIPLTPPQANQMYMAQAKTFATHFRDIKNVYSDSAKEFQGAKSCMSAATNVLDNFFAYRISELDKLKNDLKRMHAEFMKGSEGEKSDIAVQTALLEGSDPELTKDVNAALLERSMKDMKADYDRSACPSIQGFKSDQLASKGLKNSYAELEGKISTKSPNGFDGRTYSSSHAEVVKDLTDMASSSSKLFKENFGSNGSAKGGMTEFLKGLSGQVASKNGANDLLVPGSFTNLISGYNAEFLPLSKKQDELMSELGDRAGDPAVRSLTDMNSTNFDSQLGRLENRMKYECLERALASKESSIKNILSKSYDPGKSKAANAAASNIFDTKLAEILNNPNSSPEAKLEALSKAKKDEKRIVKQSSWYKVATLKEDGTKGEDRTVSKGNVTASDYYADIINNCDVQFKTNKLNSSMTGKSAIESLRSLRANYKTLMERQANALQKDIKKKLIECESPNVANSSDAESCSPARFDTSKAGFCANGALSCSKNMQACTNKTQQQVEKIETARTVKVVNYNKQVQAHVAALKNLYDKTQKLYENQAKWMQGGFVALGEIGFSLPDGIVSDPKTEKIAAFQEKGVMLDDPASALKSFENNITLLKDQVSKFQGKLAKGMKNYTDKKVQLYDSVAKDAEELEGKCNSAMSGNGQMQKAAGDELKKTLDNFGQKLSTFCREYSRLAKDHPNGACVEGYSDVVQTGLEAAERLGSARASDAILEYQNMCESYNNEKKDGNVVVDYTTEQKCNMMNGKFPDANTACNAIKNPKNSIVGNYCQPRTIRNEDDKTSWDTVFDCKKAEDDIRSYFSQAVSAGKVKIDRSSAPKINSEAPEYCEADDDENYRYNRKYFIPGALGQQGGGAIATGM